MPLARRLALRNKRSKDVYPTVTRMLDRAETKNNLLAKDPQREDDQSPLPEKAMFALLKFFDKVVDFIWKEVTMTHPST